MSNLQQQQQEIQINIEDAKQQAHLYGCLTRLSDNQDFKDLIDEDFLVQEAQRACGAKAEIGMIMNEPAMVMIDNIITGVGALRQYFLKVQIQGRNSAQALADDQATKDEIDQELAAE